MTLWLPEILFGTVELFLDAEFSTVPHSTFHVHFSRFLFIGVVHLRTLLLLFLLLKSLEELPSYLVFYTPSHAEDMQTVASAGLDVCGVDGQLLAWSTISRLGVYYPLHWAMILRLSSHVESTVDDRLFNYLSNTALAYTLSVFESCRLR